MKSMTGYGRKEQAIGDKVFLVEIKSLNGKQLDIQLKLPSILKAYEMDIRNLLQESLLRGSIECMIVVKQNGSARPVSINTELVNAYYQQMHQVAQQNGADDSGILAAILRLPEVVAPATDMISEQEFSALKTVLTDAIGELDKHRITEGAVLKQDLIARIDKIRDQEAVIIELAPRRIIRIKQELHQLLTNHVGKESVDPNRLEQELIYYMEKIDIHEEQIRLRQHCSYFLEIVQGSDTSKGKKLAFVLQEIGREINTTGSKAYDADIQRAVVVMKDELEKAKEQALNVL
jgi:uncharacterized protein (TIGR00255 family)